MMHLHLNRLHLHAGCRLLAIGAAVVVSVGCFIMCINTQMTTVEQPVVDDRHSWPIADLPRSLCRYLPICLPSQAYAQIWWWMPISGMRDWGVLPADWWGGQPPARDSKQTCPPAASLAQQPNGPLAGGRILLPLPSLEGSGTPGTAAIRVIDCSSTSHPPPCSKLGRRSH